ncbi:hypothetical protein [Endozoicomonas ascidiicola]|uniref:hypothetical protein n=1 Tax=Endozoicomonas ascidiicola TaxID=1698521 RepID=UPI000A9ADFFF|nr:hypothetical protein [Endozoicomonas ascidiicola]
MDSTFLLNAVPLNIHPPSNNDTPTSLRSGTGTSHGRDVRPIALSNTPEINSGSASGTSDHPHATSSLLQSPNSQFSTKLAQAEIRSFLGSSGLNSSSTARLQASDPESGNPSSQTVVQEEQSDTSVVQAQNRNFRLGGALVPFGISQICIGVFDYLYHVDEDHVDDEDHAGEGHAEEGHGDEDHANNEVVFRQLRQAGHIFEGSCNVLSGTARILTGFFPNHSAQCKKVSNVLQTVSSAGTGLAAIADGLHGDFVHAGLHASQFVSNVITAVPPLFTNHKGLNAVLQTTGSAFEACASFALGLVGGGPFYMAEGAFNAVMAQEYALDYRADAVKKQN